MKARKIALSLVAVAGLMSVGANAGKIEVKNAGKFAKELTVGQSVEVNATNLNLKYTYQHSVPIQGGNIVVHFTGGKVVDNNLTGTYFNYVGDNNVSIPFNSLSTDGKTATYKMDSNASIPSGAVLTWDRNVTQDANISLNTKLDSGSTSFKVSIDVANTGGDIKDSAGATSILDGVQELSAKVLTKFDGKIDPVVSYIKFINSQAVDKAILELDRAGLTSNSVGDADTTVTLYSDTKITDFGTLKVLQGTSDITSSCTSLAQNGQEYSMDCNLTWGTGAVTKINFDFTADGSHKIQETNFWVATKVNKTDNNSHYSSTILEKSAFGNWQNYGYRAQIPDVMGTANFKTYLKFTNASSLDADVYIAIRDMDGTVVTLSSADGEIASLPAGKTVKYIANTFLQTAYDKDNDLDINHSVSIELNIPATPEKVYGFASLKNVQLGQFKDLPVYNTSSMTY